MAKFRLFQRHRERIMNHVRRTLVCQKEQDAELKAHAELLAAFDSMVATMCPPEEMAVLRKQDCIAVVTAINFAESSGTKGFTLCFCPRDPRSDRGCGRPSTSSSKVTRAVPLIWTYRHATFKEHLPEGEFDKLYGLNRALRAAEDAHTDARNEVIRAAQTALDASRTFEALLEVWPGAEAFRSVLDLPRELPAVINPAAFTQVLGAATFAPAQG